MDALAACAALADGVAQLPPTAPADGDSRERLRALARTAERAAAAIRAGGDEPLARLATACGRCLLLVADGTLVAEYAVPVLAASAHTLHAACAEAAPDRRLAGAPVEAARYELETLFPVPGQASPGPRAPDVPLSELRRRKRR